MNSDEFRWLLSQKDACFDLLEKQANDDKITYESERQLVIAKAKIELINQFMNYAEIENEET